MAKIELKLKDFTVPNYVLVEMLPGRREDGINIDGNKFTLSQVDADSLGQLCDHFRAAIFEKAGKQDPRTGKPKIGDGLLMQ
jgi:hypothetical protein